jgi:diacylglycerol kinase family enzyme
MSGQSRRAPTAADRVAVVVNGNAKGVTDELVAILDQLVQAGDLFVSRSLEEGQEIAERIVDKGYPTVLTGGGDGTFCQMVTWVVDRCAARGLEPPRFGLLRLGTGNALAWVLGAENTKARGIFADLARLRRQGGHGTLRLLRIAGKLAPFAGIGVDGMAIEHFNQVKQVVDQLPPAFHRAGGGLSHFVSIAFRTMPEVLVRPTTRVRIVNRGAPAVRLDGDGQPTGGKLATGATIFEGPVRSVLFSTVPYWGFGARIFPFADPHGDAFNVRCVNIGSVQVAAHIRSIWDGSYRDARVTDFSAEAVDVELETPKPLEVAGDPAGRHAKLTVELHPRPIRVVDYYAPPPVA